MSNGNFLPKVSGHPIGPILRVQESKRKPVAPTEFIKGRVWAVKSLSSVVSASRALKVVAVGWVDDSIEKCERGKITMFEFVSKVSYRYNNM